MKFLVDVVNLNADASCLSSSYWLKCLKGGKSSSLYNFFNIYVKLKKKVSLGLTGATVADISEHNPECIELINNNPEIFELLIRPFSHDIALLRTPTGFKKNLETGIKVLSREFHNITNYFLPPEFMLTNEQVKIIMDSNIDGVFINSSRFKPEIKKSIPDKPYILKGILNSRIKCIPFSGKLTNNFLDSLHLYSSSEWNNSILDVKNDNVFSWRDGESAFFLPDGNEREEFWLLNEDKKIERALLKDVINSINFISEEETNSNNNFNSYPIHSFTAWVKESRLLGFLKRVQDIEENLSEIDLFRLFIWLQVINSDILSAVEKESPTIRIKNNVNEAEIANYTIKRSNRGFEGEEYLAILEKNNDECIQDYLKHSKEPHIIKLRSRLHYLEKIVNG